MTIRLGPGHTEDGYLEAFVRRYLGHIDQGKRFSYWSYTAYSQGHQTPWADAFHARYLTKAEAVEAAEEWMRQHPISVDRRPSPERRYIRVVLAYDPADEALVRDRLDEFIEADDETDEDGWNGIQGAYVSDAYPTRDAAIEGPWEQHPEQWPEPADC